MPNVYATIADLEALGIASDALAEIDPDIKNAMLAAMSRRIDQSLNAQCKLPLRMKAGETTWGPDLSDMCVSLSAYRLLASRGFNPEGIDQNIRLMYEDAQKLLKQWSDDDGAWPDVLDSSGGEAQTPSSGPSVSSSPSRGWTAEGASSQYSGACVPFTGGNR
jgi:phage gp36-like protein